MFGSQIALIITFCVVLIFTLLPEKRKIVAGQLPYLKATNDSKKQLFPIILLWVALIVIAVTRPEEMADYKSYATAFHQTKEGRFEPGFYWIKNLIIWYNGTHIGLLFAFAFISISLKTYCIIKMSDQVWLSFLIWISTSFVIMDMITIRASVAAGLMMLSIKYKSDGAFWKMIITLSLGVLFHYSSLILIPIIPFLSKTKPHRAFYIWIIPICYCIQILGLTISRFIPIIGITGVQELYASYIHNNEANLLNLLTVGKCAIAILLWIKLDNWKERTPYALLFVKVYTLGCALFMLLGDLLIIGFRVAELMGSADIIAYTMLTYLFKKERKIVPIIICGILFYINITNMSYWNPHI